MLHITSRLIQLNLLTYWLNDLMRSPGRICGILAFCDSYS
jgi:hypothetical protein